MRIALLVVAVLLGAAAPSSAAPRVYDDGAARIAATDGRFVARVTTFTVGAPVRVLDTRTGGRSVVATPAGCTFAAIGAGVLLWSCGDPYAGGRTLDLRTGAAGLLPELPPDPSAAGPESTRYVGIGRSWARAERGGYHYVATSYISRTTGEQRSPSSSPDVVADPDLPGLDRRLCSPLRRPLVDLGGIEPDPSPELEVRGGMAATFAFSGSVNTVVLQRCGHRPQTLRRCPSPACSSGQRQPLIAAGSVIWTEGPQLRILSLRTRRTRVVAVPGLWTLVGAAGHRVYVRQRNRLKHVIV